MDWADALCCVSHYLCVTKETLSKCTHLSEEDKGSKMAAADSVQQRRQYRRQNQQSSSGMDNKRMSAFHSHTCGNPALGG
jgi:hypothetical protein